MTDMDIYSSGNNDDNNDDNDDGNRPYFQNNDGLIVMMKRAKPLRHMQQNVEPIYVDIERPWGFQSNA